MLAVVPGYLLSGDMVAVVPGYLLSGDMVAVVPGYLLSGDMVAVGGFSSDLYQESLKHAKPKKTH